MNIQTVRENLVRTIEGKKELLRSRYANADALSNLSDENLMMWNITAKFLRLNIEELERILRDVESCSKKEGTVSWEH